MPAIDLSILNQRQTPAFYADTLANRPSAGFIGRIFVSTDTFAFYRDNGTTWDLIGGPGTGTITGSGTNGTIPLWNGASTIGDSILTQSGSLIELKATGANNAELSIDSTTGNFSRILFANNNVTRAIAYWNESTLQLTYGTYVPGGSIEFETANNATALVIDSSQNSIFYGSIGVGTPTPGAAIDVHSAVNVIGQLNQTVATNNSLLAFQNNNAGLWRIGNFYNGGANDYGIFDVVGAAQPFTIKKTTGQVLIGTSTVGSGKLVVASSTSDNGIQIVGASAPSLRIDNAESGPTKRAGFGISTATNNFIQGSADRDFCMFNGSTTASPILFGIYDTTNVQEAARISAARNFIVGKTTDSGERLQVQGNGLFNGSSLKIVNSGGSADLILDRLNTSSGATYQYLTNGSLKWYSGLRGLANDNLYIFNNATSTNTLILDSSTNAATFSGSITAGGNIQTDGSANKYIKSTGFISNQLGQLSDFTGSDAGFYIIAGGGIQFVSNAANNMRLASTGNLLINTITDSGYKLQVNGASQATRFTSSETQVSVSATPTVVFDSGGGSGIWLVTVVVTGNPGQVGFAIVGQRFGGTLLLLSTGVGSQIALTVSGNTLLASQTAGGSILTSVSNMLINQGG
jgi:hypothetical protein